MYWHWLFYNKPLANNHDVTKSASADQNSRQRNRTPVLKPQTHRMVRDLPSLVGLSTNNGKTGVGDRHQGADEVTDGVKKVVQSTNIELKLVIGRHKSSLNVVQETKVVVTPKQLAAHDSPNNQVLLSDIGQPRSQQPDIEANDSAHCIPQGGQTSTPHRQTATGNLFRRGGQTMTPANISNRESLHQGGHTASQVECVNDSDHQGGQTTPVRKRGNKDSSKQDGLTTSRKKKVYNATSDQGQRKTLQRKKHNNDPLDRTEPTTSRRKTIKNDANGQVEHTMFQMIEEKNEGLINIIDESVGTTNTSDALQRLYDINLPQWNDHPQQLNGYFQIQQHNSLPQQLDGNSHLQQYDDHLLQQHNSTAELNENQLRLYKQARAKDREEQAIKRRQLVEQKRREKLEQRAAERLRLEQELQHYLQQREEHRRMNSELKNEEENADELPRDAGAGTSTIIDRQKDLAKKKIEVMRNQLVERTRPEKSVDEDLDTGIKQDEPLENIEDNDADKEKRLIEAELALQLARRQARCRQKLEFNQSVRLEAIGLTRSQHVTRAFAFSYHDVLKH